MAKNRRIVFGSTPQPPRPRFKPLHVRLPNEVLEIIAMYCVRPWSVVIRSQRPTAGGRLSYIGPDNTIIHDEQVKKQAFPAIECLGGGEFWSKLSSVSKNFHKGVKKGIPMAYNGSLHLLSNDTGRLGPLVTNLKLEWLIQATTVVHCHLLNAPAIDPTLSPLSQTRHVLEILENHHFSGAGNGGKPEDYIKGRYDTGVTAMTDLLFYLYFTWQTPQASPSSKIVLNTVPVQVVACLRSSDRQVIFKAEVRPGSTILVGRKIM